MSMFRISSGRKIGGIAASILFTAAAAAPTAYGFCPRNGLRCGEGYVGRTHEDITWTAVSVVDAEFFSVPDLTVGMSHAIDDIAAANAAVDDDQTIAENHFDGESFAAGKARISTYADKVVADLAGSDVKSARMHLGGLLHTLQDFYSHSTWIETGHLGSEPALWQGGVSFAQLASPLTPTCQSCLGGDCSHNLTTDFLTSGYYHYRFGAAENATPSTQQKCRHGGPFDIVPGPDGGINKDTTSLTFSPHAAYHAAAAESATVATEDFLRDLRGRLTERQLGQLLGVGPTLAMAIDTTGSMGEEIVGVRGQAVQIVDARIGTDEEPGLYVLSPFNDPAVGPLTVTTDPEEFKAAIEALTAAGGGDCPELAMSGVLAALDAVDEGAELFLWTDADAKDSGLLGDVLSRAAAKHVQVYPLLFGSCAGPVSGPAAVSASSSGVDPTYVRLAGETGGQLFLLTPAEAGTIVGLADALVRTNGVDILAVTDVSGAGTSKTYAVPVDATLTSVTFVATGTAALQVKRPDGSVVHAGDSGAQVTTVTSGTLILVERPAVGLWKAVVTGNAGSSFTLAAKAEGSLSFDRFDFVQVGAGGHQGYVPIDGLPLIGGEVTAAAALAGPFATVGFELHDATGALLRTLSLTAETGGDPSERFGTVAVPHQPFVVYARGTDLGGNVFQRLLPKPFQPQTLQVTAPAARRLTAGTSASYVFEVKNLGSSGTFRAAATDDRGFLVSVEPAQFDLAANRKINLTVRLALPASTPDATLDALTVSADSLTAPGVRNYAVIDSTVISATP